MIAMFVSHLDFMFFLFESHAGMVMDIFFKLLSQDIFGHIFLGASFVLGLVLFQIILSITVTSTTWTGGVRIQSQSSQARESRAKVLEPRSPNTSR